jgi:hypothetical protein
MLCGFQLHYYTKCLQYSLDFYRVFLYIISMCVGHAEQQKCTFSAVPTGNGDM